MVNDYIYFAIPTPSCTISSVSLDKDDQGEGGHKRGRTIRSRFIHPQTVDITKIIHKEFKSPYITISEKEFIDWIGRVSLDAVGSLEILGWLKKVKEEYERHV